MIGLAKARGRPLRNEKKGHGMSDADELPRGWETIDLGSFIIKGGGTVDPTKHLDEQFELFSIPAYDSQTPETVKGSHIGSTKKVVQENDVLLSRIVPHIQRSWGVPKSRGGRQIIGRPRRMN